MNKNTSVASRALQKLSTHLLEEVGAAKGIRCTACTLDEGKRIKVYFTPRNDGADLEINQEFLKALPYEEEIAQAIHHISNASVFFITSELPKSFAEENPSQEETSDNLPEFQLPEEHYRSLFDSIPENLQKKFCAEISGIETPEGYILVNEKEPFSSITMNFHGVETEVLAHFVRAKFNTR